MKKIIKHLKRTGDNNRGMTLVEVIVATAVFGILSSMVAFIFNSSLRQQVDTEQWNSQTDLQTSYIAEHRYNDSTAFNSVGGATQYTLKIEFSNGTIEATGVDLYSMDTLYETNSFGTTVETDENTHIRFFRVR